MLDKLVNVFAMNERIILRLFAVVCLLLAIGCNPMPNAAKPLEAERSNSSSDTHYAKLDEIVAAEMARRRIPGAAIAIVHKGRVLFAKAYGLANARTAQPVTLNTRFWIGSITKQFTAMAIMMLVEEGRIALDDKVSAYLPKLPLSYQAVTVRHLLTHTSGIQRDIEKRSQPPFKMEVTRGNDLLEALAASDPAFEPGSDLSYSNPGYVLLGMLIEKLSGQTYRNFLKSRIFKPLGMSATRAIDASDGVLPRLAVGHDWLEHNESYWIMAPKLGYSAGSIISTVIDMAKWDAALYTEKLVSRVTLEQMWTPHRLNNQELASLGTDDQGIHYKIGFGWFINDEPGNFVAHHGGGVDGLSSYIDRYFGDQLTIIVFVNRDPAPIARAISRLVAKHYRQHMKAHH